jgi:competence CoiA-like predicted nuclease
MYALAEKAINFYLENSDIVERQGYGHTHQLYTCPQCAEKLVFRNGELVAILSSHDDAPPCESSRELLLTGSTT